MGRFGKQLTKKVRTSTPSLTKWYLFLTFLLKDRKWSCVLPSIIYRGEFTHPTLLDLSRLIRLNFPNKIIFFPYGHKSAHLSVMPTERCAFLWNQSLQFCTYTRDAEQFTLKCTITANCPYPIVTLSCCQCLFAEIAYRFLLFTRFFAKSDNCLRLAD